MPRRAIDAPPVYPEPCPNCKFIGRHVSTDLYFCNAGTTARVKSRFGEGLNDYQEVDVTDRFSHLWHLTEALFRAYDCGLITELSDTAKAAYVKRRLQAQFPRAQLRHKLLHETKNR
jgi:hypothetical protein